MANFAHFRLQYENPNTLKEKMIMAFPTQRKLFIVEDYHKMVDVGILRPDEKTTCRAVSFSIKVKALFEGI